MAIDYSKEIKDLQSISALAIDLSGRLTDKNAAVDALKTFGHTELQTIAETATGLAVELAGRPDAMSIGAVPGTEGAQSRKASTIQEANAAHQKAMAAIRER